MQKIKEKIMAIMFVVLLTISIGATLRLPDASRSLAGMANSNICLR